MCISPNWDLEWANASSLAVDTRIKFYSRTVLPLIGAWATEPGGMRPRTASHYVFRRIRHSKTRCHDGTSKIPCFYSIASKIPCFYKVFRRDWYVIGAWKSNPSGMRRWLWLALRFSPNGPSKTRRHDGTSKIPCFYTIAVEIDMCLVRGDPT